MSDNVTRLCELLGQAETKGLTLRKVPEGSRWSQQHGSYLILDLKMRHDVVVSGLRDLDGVEEWLHAQA